MSSLRKKIWNQFYSLVLADILIDGDIKSPTLKQYFQNVSTVSSYTHLINDLKRSFDTTDLDYLLQYSACIIEETISLKESQKFLDIVLTTA